MTPLGLKLDLVRVPPALLKLSPFFDGLNLRLIHQALKYVQNKQKDKRVADIIRTDEKHQILEPIASYCLDKLLAFNSRDIEEKVKDIRSLLLAQAMSSSDSVISSSVKIHEAAKEAAKAVEKSNENVFGMVNDMESSLKEHEERLNSQLLAAGVVVAVSVPVVSYIINKLL